MARMARMAKRRDPRGVDDDRVWCMDVLWFGLGRLSFFPTSSLFRTPLFETLTRLHLDLRLEISPSSRAREMSTYTRVHIYLTRTFIHTCTRDVSQCNAMQRSSKCHDFFPIRTTPSIFRYQADLPLRTRTSWYIDTHIVVGGSYTPFPVPSRSPAATPSSRISNPKSPLRL
jgi:hypothetical protein